MRQTLLLVLMLTIAASNAMAQSASESETDRLRDALRGTVAQVRALEDDVRLWRREPAKPNVRPLRFVRKSMLQKPRLRKPTKTIGKRSRISTAAWMSGTRRSKSGDRPTKKRRRSHGRRTPIAPSLKASTTLTKRARQAARQKNANLVKIDHDAVAAYRDLGVIKRIGATEPFIGLGTVARQNRAQDLTDGIIQNTQP